MTRRSTVGLLACLLAAGTALAGCSEKQEANTSLPSTSAAEPTEEELPPLGPEDLPMPDEARTQDAAGAEAFVRYYVELVNRTSEVMDPEPLRDLSDQCADCERIVSSTENRVQAGYRYVGGEVTITELTAPLVTGSTAEMALRIDQAALSVVDADGADVQGEGSEAFIGVTGAATAVWDADRTTWAMRALTFG